MQNVLDPKGMNYNKNRKYTLAEFQQSLRMLNDQTYFDAKNTYSKITKKAIEYGLDTSLRMDSVENYHKILLEANKRINAKDSKESDFIRKHLTKLIRVPIGRDISKTIKEAQRTGDWERVLDFVSNDTFTVASNNAMAKKGLEIYRAFRANGIENPTGVMDGILKKIAQRATQIKQQHEALDPRNADSRDTTFKDFDLAIQEYKSELLTSAVKNNINADLLMNYFDLWMISPYNYGTFRTRNGASRLSMQSQEVSNQAWRDVMTEFESIYQNINKVARDIPLAPEEKVIFSLPKDYNNPPSKPKQASTITDLVVYNTIKASPLTKQESRDRVYTRKMLGEKDFKTVEEFEKNLKEYPREDHNKLVEGFTLEFYGKPKSIQELNIRDMQAINKYFRDMNNRFSGDGLPSYAYWADPRTVDEAMWMKEKSFFNTGYKVGGKPIYKGVGTLGTIRNWFRETNRQMDVYTDAIYETNNELYKFRQELTPNESLALMKGIISKIEAKPEMMTNVEKKYLDKTYTVNKKKYTYKELVDKYSEVLSKDMETFGNEWLFARDANGKDINFDAVDLKQDFKSHNEYLKWNKNGSFDIMNFIKKAVSPGDRAGARVPRIPLENIYRFQYEYNLEKQIAAKKLSGKAATDYRINYRKNKKTAFRKLGRQDVGTYFPHLGFGWNKGARREIEAWKKSKGEEAYQEAINKGLSKKEAERIRKMRIAELEGRIEAGELEAGGMDKHAIDEMLQRLDYKNLSPDDIANSLQNIGFNTRPENILERTADMPGFDPRISSVDAYKEKVIRANYRNLGSVMANYRIDSFVKKNPMGEFTKEQFKKFNPDPKNPDFNNWSDVWADYLRFYVRDAFGHMSTFNERIVRSMEHGDPLGLKNTLYKGMSDSNVIKGIEKIDKQFKKFGINAPFFRDIPEITAKKGTPEYNKQATRRKEYLSEKIHNFGRLEARFELLTLLANTGTLTANMFGGSSMTITSAGMRNFTRANNFKWLKKNVLFDNAGNPTLTYINNKGKKVTVTDKAGLYKWIQDKGVIDNFINDELQYNAGLKNAISKNAKASRDFIRDLKKLLRTNPDASNETVLELARRYGVHDAMLKFGGAFMQVSERKLRRDAFISHVLQAKDRLGMAGKDMTLDDPYLVDMGLKGIEATQFLYHSAFRPAFMRTSMGKVMTRFKLFAFQSMRVRKELYRRAKYYGFKNGSKEYENMKNLFLTDMVTMALGSILMYSLFDTALPPPYDYLQETSQLLFGNKRERERAFFGTYPRAIAPLQVVTPPAARVLIAPMKAMYTGDWDRFLDYHIHTMYPFGRVVRQVEKTVDEPYGTTQGRFMQQFFRIPTDKIGQLYDRAQLQNEREEIINAALGD